MPTHARAPVRGDWPDAGIHSPESTLYIRPLVWAEPRGRFNPHSTVRLKGSPYFRPEQGDTAILTVGNRGAPEIATVFEEKGHY